MRGGKVAVFGKRVPGWALALLAVAAASAVLAAALATPYAVQDPQAGGSHGEVAVGQTVVIDEMRTAWTGSTFDYAGWLCVGQGRAAVIAVMGQGSDCGWFRISLRNLAGNANIVRVHAENATRGLMVKFTRPGDSPGTCELYDEALTRINTKAELYMYVLILPSAEPGSYSFNVVVEVVGC